MTSPYAPPAVPPPTARAPSPRGRPSPLAASVLSFLTAGIGQMYAGSLPRAAFWLGATIVAVAVMAPLTRLGILFLPIYSLLFVGVRVASARDAYEIAERAPERASYLKIVLVWIAFVLASTAVSGVYRRFVLEAYKIPSGSMIPTILTGDHVFVDKTRTPLRGDVVVFPFPEHPKQDFVKRVLAFPGDRIEFDGSRVLVNGAPIPSCRVGPYSYLDEADPMSRHEGDLYIESLDGHRYFAFYDRTPGFDEHQGPWTVKPGELFVVGDNRRNAHDSRMWFGGAGGGVPIKTVRGAVTVIWLSISDTGVELDRMGRSIDDLHLSGAAASLAPEVARCVAELKA